MASRPLFILYLSLILFVYLLIVTFYYLNDTLPTPLPVEIKPTNEEIFALQDNVRIPFRTKMECDGYNEFRGIPFEQLWFWPSVRIFIGIWSVADKYEIRHLIRTLNLKQRRNLAGDIVDFKFILGIPSDNNPELKLKLKAENDTYGDLVMLDMVENMNNGKGYYYWKWIAEQLDTTRYDYVSKVDDDLFIHFQNLALNLRPLTRGHLYYGNKSPHSFFIRGTIEVLSVDLAHLIASFPFKKREWNGPEDVQLGAFLNKHAKSLNTIGENCLIFTDPRIRKVRRKMWRPWASPNSIAIHWLKDIRAWKGVIDLYFSDDN
ncbi:unnamed protein product [Rhizophagus irregularis]|nr:unnamed protein product [Rhizophagus irregularis]